MVGSQPQSHGDAISMENSLEPSTTLACLYQQHQQQEQQLQQRQQHQQIINSHKIVTYMKIKIVTTKI